jgi:hypothetical protein
MSIAKKVKVKTRVVHRKLTTAELIAKGNRMVSLLEVHDSYKAIPSEYTQVNDIKTGTQNLSSTYQAVQNGNKTLSDAKDGYHDQLDDDIFHFGLYAQLLSRSDPNALINTGLDVIQVGGGRSVATAARSRSTAPTAIPRLAFKHAPHPGSLFGTVTGISGVLSFEVYWSIGDPNQAESWVYYNVFAKSTKFEITGLEPSKEYYFKVRGVNAHGVSPWSAVVNIRAL